MGDRRAAEHYYKAGETAAHHAQQTNNSAALTQAYSNYVSAAYADPTWGQAHYQVGNNAADLMFQIVPTEANCNTSASVYGHSFGSGGMSVALGDASVKNINPNMSVATFNGALRPGDQVGLGSDWAEN